MKYRNLDYSPLCYSVSFEGQSMNLFGAKVLKRICYIEGAISEVLNDTVLTWICIVLNVCRVYLKFW